ncbi:WEE protein kinase [Puccinia triticina 1-1 BBBD Race 1]|uniref:Protein kinase domain-containing protein n=1 Tax=Puccinia triticina (isolate 1-1 / race 1 (BBBD)) TaxID=630390 RepID=A0A180GM76_PUCT1|nr:WEE protein kinase [Puccinia triticina 1-1 BBBD Race 1]
MAQLPSSPQPARRTFDSLKKHSSSTSHKTLFGTAAPSHSFDSPLAHPSPALSPASAHPADRSASRRSNSSSQSNPFLSSFSSQTPPATWAVSGKLVRKKASGLFREAARSWGRSKSKEVLSFGLGVLIGNQDAQAANPPPPTPPPLPANPSIPPAAPPATTTDHHHHHQDPATPNQAPSSGTATIPSSAGTIGKGPKKRISFHSSKKVKGKPKDNNAKIIKRRSEIGFGDWADTLNTAVDSSSPQSQPHTEPSEIPASSSVIHPQSHTPLLSTHLSSNHLSSHPSAPMALSHRRRERSANLTKQSGVLTSSLEIEAAPSALSSRVPRSTFPHAHRSPRSPRRFYNTRAAVHRSQSQNLPSQFLSIGETSTPQAQFTLNGHTQNPLLPNPTTSSLFQRSISPINQFDDDFDVESPIASKALGRASFVPPRLRSVSSARANLFGAMPNKSGGLEPSSYSTPAANSSTPHVAQPNHPLSQWLNGSQVDPAPPNSIPRSRQRTVSATLQEHSSRLNPKHLTTLAEDGCDSDPETGKSGFGSSPSQSPPLDTIDSNGVRTRSSSSSQKTGFQDSRAHPNDRWVMPRIEGLDMTPRRRSLDGSLDDSDPDEKGGLALSSKPSSRTSIASSLTTHESENPGCGASDCSLKPFSAAFDGFGALPPPESPFPGPHRIKRGGIPPASPNNLKRHVDGELVSCTSQPTLYRHRTSGPAPPLSFPNLRTKNDPFEPVNPQRHSWGLQSNNPSEDDEDDLGQVAHRERDGHNGSHESHEAMSNLSVPALTDSSSLASSLASSSQSNNPYAIRPPVDGPALISSWDKSPAETGREAKRRSLPTDVSRAAGHHLTPAPPPLPIGLSSTPISVKHSLVQHPSLRPLIQSANSSFQEAECSFQNVKPNASAFLSSGMISKKTVARDRRENSLSNSSALFKYALSNVNDPNASIGGESICNVSVEASIAVKSMCEALGGPRVIVAAKREDEHQSRLSEQYEQSISMQSGNQSFSPNQSSLGIVLPECLRQPSVSSLRMPDTPMKKPAVLHKSHPHINKPFMPSGLRKLSSSYSPSIGGSPVDDSPTSRGHHFSIDESPIPQFHSQFPRDPLCLAAQNDTTPDAGSSSWVNLNDVDPSPSLSRANTSGQVPSGLESLVRQSPIYRRRSSDGVLSNHSGNGNLSRASGSRQSNPFDDPGTPTKPTTSWLKRAQLLASPGNSISSVTSSPSMHHHSHTDRLSTNNSSAEHLLDPQVTPNRQGGRSYTPFALSPMLGTDFRQGSRSHLTPGPENSASPPPRRPSFNKRHSSPMIDDYQLRTSSHLFGQTLSRRLRYDAEFDELETIGKGEFGEVFKVRQNSTGKVFAIKRPTRPANGPKALARQYEEVDILRRLTQGPTRSAHIIQLHAAWEEDSRWNIQTEFCENGTLEHFLGLIAGFQDRVDEERIWKITAELAQAVAFMHSSGVLHLDIKPANIFITAHGGLKVGDFGLARRWPRVNPSEVRECGLMNGRHKVFQHVPINPSEHDDSIIPSRFLRYEDVSDTDAKQMMRFKSCGRFVGFDLEREGDREYIAPEILSGRYGEEADVFSVGLIALEIATNVVLPDNGDEWRSLRSSDFSRTDLSHLSSELVLLIKRMMDKCPDRRITSSELTRHPVIAKLKILRDAGLAQENQGIDGTVEYEETEVLDVQADPAGDILMAPGDDSPDFSVEQIKPLRPVPPPDRIWRTARGAVLPEAEGFLPFILTGQSTPSRFKNSVSSSFNNRNFKTTPCQLSARGPETSNDQMEIDA